jgi:hypothetical protein
VIDEAGSASVAATFGDPGTADTHTAQIDWGDGTAAEVVSAAGLAAGFEHVYGDNGTFDVTVTVTDDDGGAGSDVVQVVVGNLDPTLTLDTSGLVTFPGGDHLVVGAGADLPSSADGTDPGSDDLTFSWSVGDVNTYFNDGVSPDPAESPLGTFPFMASDSIDAVYADPGVVTLAVVLTDDDGGTDEADADVIVTGTADRTEGSGWWKHQYSGNGAPHVDATTAHAYLDIVSAVSSVFDESVPLADPDDAHAVLSPHGGDRRATATSALLQAWLTFASGAVAWDDDIDVAGGEVTLLELMFHAEEVILDGTSTNVELRDVEHALARVRHAA